MAGEMTMVERAARAIHSEAAPHFAWERLSEYSRGRVTVIARAAIEAMREPTREMHDAAVLTFVRENGGIEHAPVMTWKAMIDAALSEAPSPR